MAELRGWRPRVTLILVSSFVGLVVAWTAGELYLRAFRPSLTPDTVRRASLEYEATLFARNAFPRMAQVGELNGCEIRINRRGYRGRSFDIPKPEGRVRIVVLGGSAGFDVYAPEGRDWPRLVEAGLHELGHDDVEVVNASTPAHATFDSLGRLYAEIWMLDPDYVVVYHAWNDIKYFSWLEPDLSLLRGYRPMPTSKETGDFVSNPFMYYSGPMDRLLCTSQLWVRLRTRYWRWRLGEIGLEGLHRNRGDRLARENPLLDAYPQWGPRQYALDLRLITHAIREIGATPVLLTQGRLVAERNSPSDLGRIALHVVGLSHRALVQAFADCDRAVAATAEAQEAAFLDVGATLNGRSGYFIDHVHTTPPGSAAIAREVTHLMDGAIGSRRDRVR